MKSETTSVVNALSPWAKHMPDELTYSMAFTPLRRFGHELSVVVDHETRHRRVLGSYVTFSTQRGEAQPTLDMLQVIAEET